MYGEWKLFNLLQFVFLLCFPVGECSLKVVVIVYCVWNRGVHEEAGHQLKLHIHADTQSDPESDITLEEISDDEDDAYTRKSNNQNHKHLDLENLQDLSTLAIREQELLALKLLSSSL